MSSVIYNMAAMYKAGALVLRALARPLANRFEAYVMQHPIARSYVISAAQGIHRLEVYISRGAEGKTGKAFVGEMTEERSIKLASQLASEGFILLVGVAVISTEYERQRQNEMAKKGQQHEEHISMLNSEKVEREALSKENSLQRQRIGQMLQHIESLEGTIDQKHKINL